MNTLNIKKVCVLLVLIMMLGIISTGCKKTEMVEVSKSPYIGGTKGVIAEFMDMGIYNEQTRINEIYEDESFPIEILLTNKGEANMGTGDVTITLKGIYLGSFSGITSGGVLSNENEIEEISDTNKQGGEEVLDFTPGSEDAQYTTSFSGTSVDLDVFAEIVYRYKTESTVKKVCFKEDLQDKTVCEVDEVKNVFSSGAPIQVKHAKESTAGSAKIAVEIDVENVGDGDVAIIGDDFDRRYNKFSFSSSDENKWECRSSGKMNEGRFDSAGKAKIICKLREPMPEETLYTEDLGLTLKYQYRTLIQESVRIKKE